MVSRPGASPFQVPFFSAAASSDVILASRSARISRPELWLASESSSHMLEMSLEPPSCSSSW